MKKLSFVLALVLFLTCAVLAACGGESDTSSAAESSKVETSKVETSKPATSKPATSKPAESSKPEESSEPEVSEPVVEPAEPIAVTGEVISTGCEYEVPGGKGVVLASGEWPCSYTADLTDGVANNELVYDNTWFAFNANPDDDGQANMINDIGTVIIDLGAAKNVSGVKANIAFDAAAGIAPVGSIVVSVSTDGITYTNPVKLTIPTTPVGLAEGGFEAVSAQYVKVEFTKGGDGAFMFVNEIEVYGAK